MKLIHASVGPVALVPEMPDPDMLQDGHEAARKIRPSGVSGMTIDAQIRSETAREAAAYTAMLATAPTDPTDDLVALYEALKRMAGEMEALLNEQFPDRDWPSYSEQFERRMAPVTASRAALARFKLETPDAG